MKNSGEVTIPVTINLIVKYETDDDGRNPLPMDRGFSAVIGGARWALPSAFTEDNRYHHDIEAAIERHHSQGV